MQAVNVEKNMIIDQMSWGNNSLFRVTPGCICHYTSVVY